MIQPVGFVCLIIASCRLEVVPVYIHTFQPMFCLFLFILVYLIPLLLCLFVFKKKKLRTKTTNWCSMCGRWRWKAASWSSDLGVIALQSSFHFGSNFVGVLQARVVFLYIKAITPHFRAINLSASSCGPLDLIHICFVDKPTQFFDFELVFPR